MEIHSLQILTREQEFELLELYDELLLSPCLSKTTFGSYAYHPPLSFFVNHGFGSNPY